MRGTTGCGPAWSWHWPVPRPPEHRVQHQALQTNPCKALHWGQKHSSGLLVLSMFLQLEGELKNTVELWVTSRCSGAELLHSTTGLCCQHGRGGEERREASHPSASQEGLLIPEYELQENQSFIFTLFSCLQIKVKAPVL